MIFEILPQCEHRCTPQHYSNNFSQYDHNCMPWQCSLCVPRDSQASNALGKSPHCLNVILLFLVLLAIRFLFITKHVYVSLSVSPHLDILKIYINPIAQALMSVAFHQFYLFFLLHCSLRQQQQSIELP